MAKIGRVLHVNSAGVFPSLIYSTKLVINDKILPVFELALDFEELFCAIQQDVIYLHGDSTRTYLFPTALEVKNQELKLP